MMFPAEKIGKGQTAAKQPPAPLNAGMEKMQERGGKNEGAGLSDQTAPSPFFLTAPADPLSISLACSRRVPMATPFIRLSRA